MTDNVVRYARMTDEELVRELLVTASDPLVLMLAKRLADAIDEVEEAAWRDELEVSA